MEEKKVIWTSDVNLEDWEDFLAEEYPELTSESEKYDFAIEENNRYLDDERANLNIQLVNPILIMANLGLWYGRRSAYKEIESGNIKDCLYSDTDYAEWFVDEKNDLVCRAAHHDGTNYYTYRGIKANASEEDIEDLEYALYSGAPYEELAEKVTEPLGPYIAKVYGW